MKIVSYARPARAGVVHAGWVVDAAAALRLLQHGPVALETEAPPLGVRTLLEWRMTGVLAEAVAAVAEALERGAEELVASGVVVPAGDVTLGPPVPNPTSVVAVGLNYRSHAAETGREPAGVPTLFPKFRNTLTGHRQPIRLPARSTHIDYEGELAVVMGTYARDVPRDEALAAVAGYTVLNDVSARDYQRMTSQFTAGKSFDTFAPCGPFLVTADEVPDPSVLEIVTTVSGEVLQSATTKDMVFDVPTLIEFVSGVMTLRPGDVISTGTPEGVGEGRTPQRWLRDGDVVQVSIPGVGTLENPVVA